MSNNEQHSTFSQPNVSEAEGVSSAEAERVTAKELTKALERIEARKEEESRRLSGTIALGEAVRELSLSATPEDIFAEIQMQRRLGQTTMRGQFPPVVTSAASDSTEALPPAPHSKMQDGAQKEVTHCPACSRKLLTQASALCNWCGAIINDPDYQAHAAETRQMRDQTERQQIESVVQEETRYGILGRLKRRAKNSPGGAAPLG
jgi:hypothetical protein